MPPFLFLSYEPTQPVVGQVAGFNLTLEIYLG